MFLITINNPIGQVVTIPGLCTFTIPETLNIAMDNFHDSIISSLEFQNIIDYTVAGYQPPPVVPIPVIPGLGMIYVDRGDLSDPDFISLVPGTFITDVNWHELDLSGIVPVGTIAAYIQIAGINDTPNCSFIIKRKGFTTEVNSLSIFTQTANIVTVMNGIVGMGADRKIEYQAAGGTWVLLVVVVLGWYV